MRKSQTTTDGRIEIRTYKDGFLSRIAHDLRLTLSRFEIESDGERVLARFWPASLSVDGAMRGGQLEKTLLSDADRAEIVRNIQSKILFTDRHPEARLEGRVQHVGSEHRVSGKLALAGQTRDLDVSLSVQQGRLVGKVELRPSHWGIVPFKALLGAIRLQDRVDVCFDLPVFIEGIQ